MPAVTDETLSQLAEVARRGPDWDGFGSSAASPLSIRRARTFWLELLAASSRVTSPAVVTSSSGSVSFVWANGVEIHFPPTGAIFSVREENGDVRVADLRDIVEGMEMIPRMELG
jgi:hypothetical protein